MKQELNLESSFLKDRLSDLLSYYEEVYSGEPDHFKRVQMFLDRSLDIVGADAISVFSLQGSLTDFVLDFGVGPPLFQTMSMHLIGGLSEFEDSCTTHTLTPVELSRLVPDEATRAQIGSLVVSTFNLHGTPGFVLYVFGSRSHGDTLLQVCNFVSREVFHLLRAKELRSQYEVLRALSEIDVTQDSKEVLSQVFFRMRAFFGAHGVSIVEVVGQEEDRLKFLKKFLHHKRQEERTFLADQGLAHYSIVNKKALLVHEIVEDSNPYGRCIEFDPERLTLGHAKKDVHIPTIVMQGTIEKEVSAMYFPLLREAGVLATIKVASFSEPRAFGLRELRALAAFSGPILRLLEHQHSVSKLKAQIAKLQLDERILEQAEALLFYREVTLGVFHQLGDHINTLEISLSLLEPMIMARREQHAADVQRLLNEDKEAARLAKRLIKNAQKKGQLLKPVGSECLLIEDIVQPAMNHQKERFEQSRILFGHTLTTHDYNVFLDPDLARETITNLLHNAHWAIKSNSGAGKRELVIAIRPDTVSKTVRVEIEDSGIGMDRETLEKVAQFKPFVTFRPGGTGLGLYFAKRLFTFFGGDIRIERSEPTKGTMVAVVVPLKGVVTR